MDLENRIRLLIELGEYMQSDDPAWQQAKIRAFQENAWFTPEFIDLAIRNLNSCFLQKEKLEAWVQKYKFPSVEIAPRNIGLVMAGNIPLVGFHDFLCCFISGHRQVIKLSSKDSVLFSALLAFLVKKHKEVAELVQTSVMLKGMDAYIATGSNNSARYFDYYFGKYPSLIRKNRTSVALLDGNETPDELSALADDVFLYFGLGCRNVTQIHVPVNYDFVPLLQAFRKYLWTADHNKYKNNYDYRLSLAILNKLYYMTNDCILLMENESPFSPISVLHYQYYENIESWKRPDPESIQCVVSRNDVPFGHSQKPSLTNYADGVDTMQFLRLL